MRVNELTNAILLAIEHAELVKMEWIDELHDICKLHNLYGVPERTTFVGRDGTTITV